MRLCTFNSCKLSLALSYLLLIAACVCGVGGRPPQTPVLREWAFGWKASYRADQERGVRWWWCVGRKGVQPSLTGCGTERKSQVLGRDQITFPFCLNYSLPVHSRDWLSFVSFWGAPPSSLSSSLNFTWALLPSLPPGLAPGNSSRLEVSSFPLGGRK